MTWDPKSNECRRVLRRAGEMTHRDVVLGRAGRRAMDNIIGDGINITNGVESAKYVRALRDDENATTDNQETTP